MSDICAACGGDGYYKEPRLGDEPCPQCGGSGRMVDPADNNFEPDIQDWDQAFTALKTQFRLLNDDYNSLRSQFQAISDECNRYRSFIARLIRELNSIAPCHADECRELLEGTRGEQ